MYTVDSQLVQLTQTRSTPLCSLNITSLMISNHSAHCIELGTHTYTHTNCYVICPEAVRGSEEDVSHFKRLTLEEALPEQLSPV